MKTKAIILTIAALALLLLLYSGTYLPITGTVVDEETGKPVEGAVVLVEWTRKVGIGDYHTESVKVVETVTGKEGKFKVSGIISFLLDAPNVTVYKRGYVAWNNKYIFPGARKREGFRWESGYVFVLGKFMDTYSYIDHQSFITLAISSTIAPEKKKLLFRTYSEAEEEQVIRERDERNRKRMRGTDK